MTISKYIHEFFKFYTPIKIDTNHLEDGADKYGLFKSPARDYERRIDGSAVITEYYDFFAFQNSMGESERKEDDEWLEDMTYWVDDFPNNYEYPEIDGNRTVTNIQTTGSPTPMEDRTNGILYLISLSITYEREVK